MRNGALWKSGPGDQLDVPVAQAHGPVLGVDQRLLVADDDLGPARAAPRGQRPAVGGQPGGAGAESSSPGSGWTVDRGRPEPGPPAAGRPGRPPGPAGPAPRWGPARRRAGGGRRAWARPRASRRPGRPHRTRSPLGGMQGHDVVAPRPRGRRSARAVRLASRSSWTAEHPVLRGAPAGGVAFSQPGHGVAQRQLHRSLLRPGAGRSTGALARSPFRCRCHHGAAAPSACSPAAVVDSGGSGPTGWPSGPGPPRRPGAPRPAGSVPAAAAALVGRGVRLPQ